MVILFLLHPFCFDQLKLCGLIKYMMMYLLSSCTVGIKKTEPILNHSQSMKFVINIDCLGTYDVE